MAPNRKQLSVVLDDPFVDTTSLVQAKYLPLTAEASEESNYNNNSIEEKARSSTTCDAESDDYWSWPTATAAAPTKNEDTKMKDLFSMSHMEDNLRKDSERRRDQTTEVITRAKESSTTSDYWAERVEAHVVCSEANASVSQEVGYWEWPQDKRAISTLQIALLLKEEFARHLTSGNSIEGRLVQDAAARKHSSLPAGKAENDDYWEWESPTKCHADAGVINESYWQWNNAEQPPKDEMVAMILAYETTRAMFSASHVQDTLVESCYGKAAQQESMTTVNTLSDAYWTWPAPEDVDYWNMRPTAAAATTASSAPMGYWDW